MLDALQVENETNHDQQMKVFVIAPYFGTASARSHDEDKHTEAVASQTAAAKPEEDDVSLQPKRRRRDGCYDGACEDGGVLSASQNKRQSDEVWHDHGQRRPT